MLREPAHPARIRSKVSLEYQHTPERAVAMLGALDEKDRAELPPEIDITCHMCGRTFTVKTA